MNTLRTLWDNGRTIHEDLYLYFENKELVSFEVKPEKLKNVYTREVVDGLIKDLHERKMITFWDDIPKLLVSVPVWDIGMVDEVVFIETFHYHGEEYDEDIWRDDCNVPVPLYKFLGLKKSEVKVTDF
jgi:hypothetical protein